MLDNPNFCFLCEKGKTAENFIELFGIIENCFNYIFLNPELNKLSQKLQKIHLIALPNKSKVFSFKNLVFFQTLNSDNKKRNFIKISFFVVTEILHQLFLENIELFKDRWFLLGFPMFLAYDFFDKNTQFIDEIDIILINLRTKSMLLDLNEFTSHSLNLPLENTLEVDFFEKSSISIYKSFFIFRRLENYIELQKLLKIAVKKKTLLQYSTFIEIVEKNVQGNKIFITNWLEECLSSSGVNELKIEIEINNKNDKFIKEFYVLQNLNQELQTFKKFFVEIKLINSNLEIEFEFEVI